MLDWSQARKFPLPLPAHVVRVPLQHHPLHAHRLQHQLRLLHHRVCHTQRQVTILFSEILGIISINPIHKTRL